MKKILFAALSALLCALLLASCGKKKPEAVTAVEAMIDALVENDNGLTGVYVLAGKRVVFKPINILYHADNHVMAVAAVYYNKDGEIDKEKTPDLPRLAAYDRVIVKGKNLNDGKVIDSAT